MTFSPALTSTLVIPAKDELLLVTIPTMETRQIHPFPRSELEDLVDVAFSPVVERKGGLCAVVRHGGKQVALVGLDSPDRFVVSSVGLLTLALSDDDSSASKLVDFTQEVVGVAFLDGATLVVRTKEGELS